MSAHFRQTDYGFEFGAAIVTRACSMPYGTVIVSITTPRLKIGLDIYVTKTGKVRVFGETTEWKPESKTKLSRK